jgi:hypothetical protein
LLWLSDGDVLMIGGEDPFTFLSASSVDRFDPDTNTWTPRAPLPRGLWNMAAVELDDGRVLVTGGNHELAPTADTLLYDPVTDSWSFAARMP